MNDEFDLKRSAELFPTHVAIATDTTTLSYLELWHAAQRVAQRLHTQGITPSTAWVAVEPRRDLESVVTVLTLVSLRLPFVVLHPAWSNEQKASVLERTGATRLHLSPSQTAALLSRSPTSGAPYRELARVTHDEAPLCVVYTSGTTGEPKGAVLSRRAFAASAHEARGWFNLTAHDRWFLSLPLAHVGGLSVLLRTWSSHASVALPPANDATFQPARFVEQCRSARATLVSLVPTQLQRICSSGLQAPSTLRCVLVGGAPLDHTLVTKAERLNYQVLRTYGLTEFCSIVATERLSSVATSTTTHSDTALTLHTHVQAQLASDGRLMLRGASSFSGYWGLPAVAPSEWFTTGDLAELVDGAVRILGRSDEVIITGGEKVHPTQVESALLACAGIEQACVFARASEEWGQEVCVALVATPAFSITQAVSHLRRCGPSFNIPRAWVVVTHLPTSANGKVSRARVARELGPACQHLQT